MNLAAVSTLRVASRCLAAPARSVRSGFRLRSTTHVLHARRASSQPSEDGPQMAGPENESSQSVDYLAAEEDDPYHFPDVPRASHHLYTDGYEGEAEAKAAVQKAGTKAAVQPPFTISRHVYGADETADNLRGLKAHWATTLHLPDNEHHVSRIRVIGPTDMLPDGYLSVRVESVNDRTPQSYRLPPLFLRDMCRCAECIDPSSRQRKYETTDLPSIMKIRAISTKGCADGFFNIQWYRGIPSAVTAATPQGLPEDASLTPPHITKISLAALMKHLHADTHPDHRPPVKGWTGNSFGKLYEAGLVRASFDDFINRPATFRKILASLSATGLAFIHGVPDRETAVEELAETIGPLRHTFYGRTWDVKDKPNAENVAYTSGYLGLHMDLLYMKEPPGLQFLHCIRSSDQGGESIFADSIRAARHILNTNRDLFDVLATFPITYGYEHGEKGLYFRDTKPVIEVDHHALESIRETVRDIYRLNELLPIPIKNINWSPPFQNSSSFTVEGGWKHPTRLAEWHRAAKIFASAVQSPEAIFSHKLKPGECVIFANRRVLHGRNRFVSQPGSGERFLKGAYVDTDDFESKLRSTFLHGTEHRRGAGFTHATFDTFKSVARSSGFTSQ